MNVNVFFCIFKGKSRIFGLKNSLLFNVIGKLFIRWLMKFIKFGEIFDNFLFIDFFCS